MKKIVSIVLALAMTAAMSATAFAAEPVMPDSGGDVSVGKDEVTIGIEGRVEPITLAATVNISTYLAIDPNQPEGSQFTTPIITVQNDCNAPITLYAVDMRATGDAPRVVAQDKFTDSQWAQLTRRQTHDNIALGLTDNAVDDGSINMWFAEEAAQSTEKLCDIPYQGEHKMQLQSRFGRAWEGGESFKYGMTVKIGLKQ